MKQSVSLITLGVSDYERAKAFYAALGRSPALEIEETAFFQANGVVLVLWAREKLATDSGIADDGDMDPFMEPSGRVTRSGPHERASGVYRPRNR